MNDFFRYDSYEKYLELMRSIAPVIPLGEWDGENAILLRHDIDIDIEAAERLSKIEGRTGIRSTFFVCISNHHYNPATAGNRKILKKIASRGCEIGLHFDPMVYRDDPEGHLPSHARTEADYLETICGSEIRSISLHNPSIHGKFPLFEGYQNAYDPVLFRDEGYLSDSSMNFRGKDPYSFIERAREQPVQVVLHPIHFTKNGDGYVEIFRRYHVSMIEATDSAMRNNKGYASQFGSTTLLRNICKGETK
jgi:hypothetical protein